jgi:hypothetical protein
MAIQDRITAAQQQIDSAKADISEYEGVLQKIADLQNQLQTAALQHGNDQQEIADLELKLAEAAKTIETDDALIKDASDLATSLSNQIQQLKVTVTYPDLEYGFWQLNLKPDAASGRGTGTFTPADNPKTPAVFSIVPDAPLSGDKDNYFNIFATQKKRPNAAFTNFLLKAQFDFPTDTDMKNAHCIEAESRQVLRLVAPATLPLMAVPAFQCNFSGNEFRYFTGTAGWASTGIAMPRQRSISVVMEAHRDDKTLFYDAFTINGQRHAVSFQAPLYAKTYVNERLSVSLQLDSHYLGGAFKVIPSGVSLEVR